MNKSSTTSANSHLFEQQEDKRIMRGSMFVDPRTQPRRGKKERFVWVEYTGKKTRKKKILNA